MTNNDLVMRTRNKTLDADTRNAMDASVKAGDCPFCGRSGFVVVAVHIAKMHGIPTRELHDGLGLLFGERICSIEHSQNLSAVHKGGYTPIHLRDVRLRVFSDKGRATVLKNLSQANASRTHEQFVEMGRIGGSEKKRPRQRDPREAKHGTRKEYDRGCRCVDCIKAFRAYFKASAKRHRDKKRDARLAAAIDESNAPR